MPKTLCKKEKKKWMKYPEFSCEKCEREAKKKKHLCEPNKMS